MMADLHVSSSVPTDLDPQVPLLDFEARMTPEQLIREWEPVVGLDDVVLTEALLEDALKHLTNILKLLPARYKRAEEARAFLAKFQQPV